MSDYSSPDNNFKCPYMALKYLKERQPTKNNALSYVDHSFSAYKFSNALHTVNATTLGSLFVPRAANGKISYFY